ncbi:hypothetical protein PPL_05362 [Heterostelium album PN500]|uniref:Uncharacterized protein n=1 Tax=Heterostelium pallidum (strain ATCC 26659 / Pp 5 / PN500) TaxID=670386 RepID=D3B9Z1_HETP5|nr:hypothetical protein PPL_05362 [Heterostelium album PN500]EFA81378.1 hypothetical protein PPL_05362 [Heterostelium album PN500]|eukprot:XP_020433496.1 hypothetical protein PPL_05362 [Heterostelium album PN500]
MKSYLNIINESYDSIRKQKSGIKPKTVQYESEDWESWRDEHEQSKEFKELSNERSPVTTDPRHLSAAQGLQLNLQFYDGKQGARRRVTPTLITNDVTSLAFSRYYNHPILPGTLPTQLRFLLLDAYFNFPLRPHVLPCHLTELNLGDSFNMPLEKDVLPQSLMILTLGNAFNKPLCNLPSQLKKLTLGSFFCSKLKLPDSLIKLDISGLSNLERLEYSEQHINTRLMIRLNRYNQTYKVVVQLKQRYKENPQELPVKPQREYQHIYDYLVIDNQLNGGYITTEKSIKQFDPIKSIVKSSYYY